MNDFGGEALYNSTYVRNGGTTNHVEINSVNGTLVKNYRKSFFYMCKADGSDAARLFHPNGSYIAIGYDRKDVIVLQTMVIANNMLLNEVMWKDDFEQMFICDNAVENV